MVSSIDHGESARAVACERGFLTALEGSCRTPIAGHARIIAGMLHFTGEALTPDGRRVFPCARDGLPGDAEALGRDAGEEVKRMGGTFLSTP